ncbi:MAG: hypothetical protein HONBIEJF_01716 [Fimbriimonadaceae bacterium]|nr:hypothetical protein [Fimbriimonadaceae bacterium]
MLRELDPSDLVKVEKPIYVHQFGRIMPGDATRGAIDRYIYRSGNGTFPKLLAQGLQIRLNSPIDTNDILVKRDFEIAGDHFSHVVVTPPVTKAIEMLRALGEGRGLANCVYRPCLSVSLGFDKPVEPLPYHAFVDPDQRHPLTWVSIENVKSPDRAPEGHTAMVAQMSPAFSRQRFESSDERIIDETLDYVQRLFGSSFSSAVVSDVTRWLFSQPETTAQFDSVNRSGDRVIVASDGVMAGRVEYAFEAGVKAALMIEQQREAA